MNERWLPALGLTCLVLLASIPVSAQTQFASFTGSVTSTDGNPVPGVSVVATNEATQVTYTAVSNEQGLYTIAALPIGTYKVRADAQNFRPFETSAIRLESGQTARVDITLTVGATEKVEVTGVTPDPADAGRGRRRGHLADDDRADAAERPQLLAAVAAAARGHDHRARTRFTEPKNFGQGRPYVNGQREQGNNYMLDGMDMNEAIDNLLPYQPSPDALAEVRVDTNNYSAEYGNVAGALVNSTIKSGTNEFHGNGFEYWRDSSLAANSWDNNRGGARKPELSQHIFGATIGGPIIQNKLFFFGDYQGFLRDRPGQQVVSVAPVAWRQGDFSGVNVAIRDPQTGQPFPGNRIPQERFSPIARAILANQQLYPLPNRAGYLEQPGDRIFRRAARPSGRRQGRREPVDGRPLLRAVFVPELQVRTGAARRSKANWSERTTRRSSAWRSIGTACSRPRSMQRVAGWLYQSQVRDESGRTGRASATPTRRSAFPAGSRLPA